MTNRNSILLLVLFAASNSVAGQVIPPEACTSPQPLTPITFESVSHSVTLAHYLTNSAESTKVDALPDELQDQANSRRGCPGDARLVTCFNSLPISPATLSVPGGTTLLTKSSSFPLIGSPVPSDSYLFRSLSRTRGENNCPNHCAFLFSVRLPLKASANTTARADALSFRLGGFMNAPLGLGTGQNPVLNVMYFGQDTSEIRYSSNLPTANHWTMGEG